MFQELESRLDQAGFTIAEAVSLEPRSEQLRQLPDHLADFDEFSKELTGRVDVWRHQAEALERLGAGENVVVSTGTASGKSLIFQLHTLHLALGKTPGKILVFYPQKALAADQHARWIRLAEVAGLPPSSIARIDGDTHVGERPGLLERASVAIMTPDVCQAWFMRNIAHPVLKNFLANLNLLILDEAHVYESVFGSNVAFLLRRLTAARGRLQRERPLQIVASTATIASPHQHLCELTGAEFTVVGDDMNGAPLQPRRLYHVVGPEGGEMGENAFSELMGEILELDRGIRGRIIAFHDSRQGVERVARVLPDKNVLPYRSGYEAIDRQKIESGLRKGTLEGVVSTSALELGIDIADMSTGLNLSVPQSRKSFRQRVGRIGRSKPGAFIVLGEPGAFRRFGETLQSYYDRSVEPSYLYLGNRFIQYAHARCLLDEIEVLGGDKSRLSQGPHWPDGFEEILRYASPSGGRPREFDLIHTLGSDNPHFNYPLRNVGEASLAIKQQNHSDRLGSIAMNQAIREAYPGATYFHLGHAYKVAEWQTRGLDRAIRVFASTKGAPTKPLLRKTVNFSIDSEGVVDGHFLKNATGILAEAHLQVTESVEGYRIAGSTHLYRDLRADNPAMYRKQRDFRTTGIVIRIDQAWFSGGSGEPARARQALAEGLKDLLARDRSIAPQDIDAAYTNLAMLSDSGPKRVTDCIVIYDAVYGGLRLTENLFTDFERYMEQLVTAAELAGDDAVVPPDLAYEVRCWADQLEDGETLSGHHEAVPDGWIQVFKPDSEVALYHNGLLISVRVGYPEFVNLGDVKALMYSYMRKDVKHMVAHAQLQGVGQDWQWALWNPETGEIRDLDDPDELVVA